MPNPLLEGWEAEVENKPDLEILHLEVCQALCRKDRLVSGNGFQFYDNAVFDKEVYSFWVFVLVAKNHALVNDGAWHLTLDSKAPLRQLPGEGGFICLLFQPATELAVNLNGRANNLFSQLFLILA